MAGDILDTNSVEIAKELEKIGHQIWKKIAVGDDLNLLTQTFQMMAQECQAVIVNGGLGPTVDDHTAVAAATAEGTVLEEHPEARKHLQYLADKWGLRLNQANLKQALLPRGCKVIPNPVGTAVGIQQKIQTCWFFFTPGPPRELKKMMREHILAKIHNLLPIQETSQLIKFQSFGIGESAIQNRIHHTNLGDFEGVNIGFRASMPYVEVKINIPSTIPKPEPILSIVREVLEFYLYTEGKETLPEKVSQLLRERGQTITIAESCTGGLIASQITAIPGSSDVFSAGFVTYSNQMKEKLLEVTSSLLETQGAVSSEVVKAMAQGALKHSGSDYVLAISGIAGPTGGTPEKPEGTVWIAWGKKEKIKTRKFQIFGDRKRFQLIASTVAFDLLRRELQGIPTDLPYWFDLLSRSTFQS